MKPDTGAVCQKQGILSGVGATVNIRSRAEAPKRQSFLFIYYLNGKKYRLWGFCFLLHFSLISSSVDNSMAIVDQQKSHLVTHCVLYNQLLFDLTTQVAACDRKQCCQVWTRKKSHLISRLAENLSQDGLKTHFHT